jgi:hypothetical protein
VIGVEVKESTQLIVLNALELEISNAKFKASNGECKLLSIKCLNIY